MNKKLTKKELMESVAMELDTYKKNKNVLDPKDKVTVVPNGTFDKDPNLMEDHMEGEYDRDDRSVEYGINPELGGEDWEEFMESVKTVPHEESVDDKGNIYEVKIKRKDFNQLNETKKWI